MENTIEFTTTEKEILIRLDKTSVNTRILEQISDYLRPMIKPSESYTRYHAAPSIQELRQMPKAERDEILRAQAALLANDENIEDDQDVMEDDGY